ncbi:hypothetical protein EYV94_06640 [Puteibacter caeruleilacunae]|nr:hypothetical protein EYV94_06640 [Puteibacter caeruleilacunae]
MKVLVVICISEYAGQLYEIFQTENLTPFFETDVRGFNLPGKIEHRLKNWFGQGNKPLDGVLNFVLVDAERVDAMFDRLKQCNKCKGETDAVFGFTLDVDQVLNVSG